jgi:hypothetical protein
MAIICPIPVWEACDRDSVDCARCGCRLDDEVYFTGDAYYCESCVLNLVADWTAEAEGYAAEHCRITAPLPPCDETCDPDSYLNYCRHNYTNYEELIQGLDRYDLADQVAYDAIRARIMELLEDRMAEDGADERASPGGH